MDSFHIVKLARKSTRPNPRAYIDYIFTNFIELHGDRNYKDDKAIIGGVAFLDGKPITVIGIQKGSNLEENIERNFGSPYPEGYRKALRLMKQAEKFNRPIITLINTSGAYCGIGAEQRGQAEAIARNLLEMANFKVPIIATIIGEGGSGGALALSLADKVFMLENSIYAILSPEGFASILWKDIKRAGEAAELMQITSKDLYKMEVIDKIIPEVEGGVCIDFIYTARILRDELISEIEELKCLSTEDLLQKRYERFRKFGEFNE